MSYKSRYVKITVPALVIPKGQQAVGMVVVADYVTDGLRTLLFERPEPKTVAVKKAPVKRQVRKATAKVTPAQPQTSFNPETFPTEKVG